MNFIVRWVRQMTCDHRFWFSPGHLRTIEGRGVYTCRKCQYSAVMGRQIMSLYSYRIDS